MSASTSVAEDMTLLLEGGSLGTQGKTLFANTMPARGENGAPAALVAVWDLPGGPPIFAHGMNPVNQRCRLQIRARDVVANKQAAHDKCQACIDYLSGKFSVSANGRTYEMIRALTRAVLFANNEDGLTIFYGEIEAVLDLG